MSPSFSATNTNAKVSKPKNKDNILEVKVACFSFIDFQTGLIKSSKTMAAKEFIPDETVLKKTNN